MSQIDLDLFIAMNMFLMLNVRGMGSIYTCQRISCRAIEKECQICFREQAETVYVRLGDSPRVSSKYFFVNGEAAEKEVT